MQFTMIMALITFIGTGVYNMYKIHTNVDQLNKNQAIIIKQCNQPNLTKEEQENCLKIFVPKN